MMARSKRSTIGENPLDAVVPSPVKAAPAPAAASVSPLERVSTSLPADLMERARNVAFWSPGITLAALLEDGLRGVVERMEAENGGAFKQRATSKLRAGRQVRG